MTPKQILDSFSDSLMRDERILSTRERALLTNLLQHARSASNENQQTQAAVWSVISAAVGETVAQRAFAVLGTSIVERILDGAGSIPDTPIRSGDIGTDLFRRGRWRGRKSPRWPPTLSIRGVAFQPL